MWGRLEKASWQMWHSQQRKWMPPLGGWWESGSKTSYPIPLPAPTSVCQNNKARSQGWERTSQPLGSHYQSSSRKHRQNVRGLVVIGHLASVTPPPRSLWRPQGLWWERHSASPTKCGEKQTKLKSDTWSLLQFGSKLVSHFCESLD